MELWLWSPVGGLVGTVLMDLTASLANALRIRWGGCGGNAAIGRWVLGLLVGRIGGWVYATTMRLQFPNTEVFEIAIQLDTYTVLDHDLPYQ